MTMTREEIEKLSGMELAAAVAEQAMGWEQNYFSWLPVAGQPEIWRHKPTGAIKEYIIDWRPDQDIEQAFRVMRAIPFRWQVKEWGIGEGIVTILLFPPNSRAVFVDTAVDVENDDWTRAWCVAICHCALLAVQTRNESGAVPHTERSPQ